MAVAELDVAKTEEFRIGTLTDLAQLGKERDPRQLAVHQTEIPGIRVVQNAFFPDERGWTMEAWKLSGLVQILEDSGISIKANPVSYSLPGTIRGIHGEMQYKVLLPLSGTVVGAYVDFRPHSPTFLKWIMLKFDNSDPLAPKSSVVLAPGIGNSFGVMGSPGEAGALYVYGVSEEYGKGDLGHSVSYKDSDIDIPWGVYIKSPTLLGERDKELKTARDTWPEKFK